MDWIDAEEAARILGVTSKTVKNYIDRGLLRGQKVNPNKRTSAFLVDRKSVEALRKQLQSPAK